MTMPIGILVVDETGRIQNTNQARQDIWGGDVPTKEIDEHSGCDGLWPDTGVPLRPEEWPIQRAIKKGETTVGLMVDIKRQDSTLATVIISTAPLKGEGGKILGAVTTMQDYTEHLRMEREMQEAKEKLELYLDILSHDVNNLNLAIRGNLELYRARMGVGIPGNAYLDNAERMLNEVSNLIENIHKLQMLENGKTVHRPMGLGQLLEDTVSTGRQTPGRKVVIDTAIQQGLVVEANELLRDVFTNLIHNAIKYTPDPVQVNVMAERTLFNGKDTCRVVVEDNGCGIPEDMKFRIFNRFQRGSPSTTGRGLGLYLVKKIIEGFGGTVWVEDRVAGDRNLGARFVVNLPIAQ
jgi:signal transduction histidine kinase